MMKTYVIAEAGVNHNGSLEMAKELIRAAAQSGVDAIKFQSFQTEELVTQDAAKAAYQIRNTDKQESQFDMLKRLELDESAHMVLFDYCRRHRIEFLSSAFDLPSLELLIKKLKVRKIKISSSDITNAPLLLRAAQADKSVILSTGMSTLGEIEQALSVLAFGYTDKTQNPSDGAFKKAFVSASGQQALNKHVELLHCTSEYPAPFDEVNLRAITTLRTAFSLPVGLSDHTQGIYVSIAAVALGASIIEKHFTLDVSLPGPDHKASLNPAELADMVKGIRQVEAALGNGQKIPTPTEMATVAVAHKSLIAGRTIKQGELFTEVNLSCKRPGDGISPMEYWRWLGKAAQRDYAKDERIE